jgi:hypothetical protein
MSLLRAGVNTTVNGVATCEFHIEETFKKLPSAGKVMCTVFWDRKAVILQDFLELTKPINSDRYIATLIKAKAGISRVKTNVSCNTITRGPIPV